MENFTFSSPTRIIFGKGTEREAGREIRRFGRKVLLHYGGGSIRQSGLHERIVAALKEAGVEYVDLGGVKPNPRLSLVQEGIRICREQGIGSILAVGGGSVIDSAKAIGVGVPYAGDVWDFYLGKAVPEDTLPVGVVLTIPAAGSESSKSSVVTNEDGWLKRALNIDLTRPVFAIMNPEITMTLPPFQTACGIADIMSHVMERYFTNVEHVDLTDRLCEGVLLSIIRNAPIVMENPDDYHARAEIMWASTIAHNDLLSTGRIGDFASHMIEHELSGIYDVAHGAGLAVIFPAWMKFVYERKLDRFVQFAVRVWGVEMDHEYPERTAREGIRRMENLFRDLGLPVTLPELGVPSDDRFEEMARKYGEVGRKGNFVTIEVEDALRIFDLAR